MYHKVKYHFITHKERFKRKIIHIKKIIQQHHQKTKEKINNMISHKFFYPILISSIALIGIFAIGTYASNGNQNIRSVENLLNKNCEYKELKINKCGKYDKYKKKIDNILNKYLPKFKKQYGKNYGKQIWQIILLTENFNISNLENKQIFILQYLNYKLREILYKIRNPEKLIITNQIGYGYGYGYENFTIPKGIQTNLQEFNFINKSEKKITMTNLILENTKNKEYININNIKNIEMKIKYGNKYINKKCEGKINKTSQKIIFPCSFYLNPKGTYKIGIYGIVEKKIKNKKIKFNISNKSLFIYDKKKLQTKDILIIKNYNFNIIE